MKAAAADDDDDDNDAVTPAWISDSFVLNSA